MDRSRESKRLRRRAELLLRSTLDPRDVVPLLHKLARLAEATSEEAAFAHQKLAELLAERDPWRAALYARRVLVCFPDDDRAWAVLALTQTLLGHFRYARRAYERALEIVPGSASYAHNLGHLLDVALDDPASALPWLAAAHRQERAHPGVAASYAHALGRVGERDQARLVLEGALILDPSRELLALWDWLHRGAGEPCSRPGAGPLRFVQGSPRGRTRPSGKSSKDLLRPCPTALQHALRRGLRHLPFSPEQRDRACVLARDASKVASFSEVHLRSAESLAAAVAYAIVFVDEVPLTHAEVAAPFRVRVAQLRGCFAELRAELSIMRNDERYAT